jgi:hypothetical protein
MARTSASAAASRIRIEDEVWDEAFSTRLPARRGRASGSSSPASTLRTARPQVDAAALRIVEAPPAEVPASAPEPRRTVRIQGRGADPLRSAPSQRTRTTYAASPLPRGMGSNPDRLAMWATLLGFLLVVVAILSSHF